MKAKRIAIPVVAAILLGLGGTWWRYGRSPLGDNAEIRVSGNIEVIDAEVSFKVPGRVQRRFVDEGEPVRAGQVIAELDAEDLKSELDVRQGERDAAKAALAELENGSRPEEKAAAKAAMKKAKANQDQFVRGLRVQEIDVARATLDRTQAEKLRSVKELDRAEKLLQSRTISQELYDQIKTAHDVALARHREAEKQFDLAKEGYRKEQVRQAREGFREAEARWKLVMKGPRAEAIEQAKAKLRQAEAAVALAQTRLGYATIRAPLSGIVLTKNVEPGEYVSPGTPVVTVADLKNVWVRAYLEGPDESRVKLGQKAIVTVDGRREPYEGRVGFIADEAEFTPKSVQTAKERTKLVYRIKIYVDNTDMGLKRGMPADARILLDSPFTPALPPAGPPIGAASPAPAREGGAPQVRPGATNRTPDGPPNRTPGG